MTAEQRGDVTRILDKQGWTRGLVYRDSGSAQYRLVGPLGTYLAVSERRGSNKDLLIRNLLAEMREAGYKP